MQKTYVVTMRITIDTERPDALPAMEVRRDFVDIVMFGVRSLLNLCKLGGRAYRLDQISTWETQQGGTHAAAS